MTPLNRKITVGADPELFIVDGKGMVGSAIGLLGGTKEVPRVVPRGAVQEDNVLAEFNIDPASTEEEFVHNLNAVRTTLNLLLPEGLYTSVLTSHEYDEDVLTSFGPQALEFGCDPDFNAYTGSVNPPPGARTTLRTAGGHIHVGYPRANQLDSNDVIRAMDLFLGVPSVLLDNDTRRRSLYGRAGACRYKNYGVEYRTLSNFWLGSNELMSWAYRQTLRAVDAALSGDLIDEEKETTMGCEWGHIQSIINNSDRQEASKLLQQLDQEVA